MKPTCEDNGFSDMRVAFWTLGCRLNQYDTEGMKALLMAEQPVRVVPWEKEADVYVLNSCTVTGKADQECRRLARQIKRKHPHSKVVVTGCYAQTQPQKLEEIAEVDGVVGNTARERITDWLPAILTGGGRIVQVDRFPLRQSFQAPLIDDFGGRSRAFVKVQDGCDLRCAYCLIWQARGPARSRRLPDVLRQLQILADRGYREVVLAGVHLGAYGRDLEPRLKLADLLRTVAGEFSHLRLRLGSIHPNEVGPDLLALWPRYPQLRPHLHISLQSGADTVLERMRRPYRRQAVRQAVQRVAATIPHCGIGADLIVGFPGETGTDFAATYDLVASLPFTYLHVFRYSPRPGTLAAGMPEPVPPEVVTERSTRLRDLAKTKQRMFNCDLHGQEREAIVESAASGSGWHWGTTDNYASVMIPGHWREGIAVACRLRRDHSGVLQAEDVRPISSGTTATANGGCGA